jgi:hypothetical protein
MSAVEFASIRTVSTNQSKTTRTASTPRNFSKEERIVVDYLEATIAVTGNEIIINGLVLIIVFLPQAIFTDIITGLTADLAIFESVLRQWGCYHSADSSVLDTLLGWL